MVDTRPHCEALNDLIWYACICGHEFARTRRNALLRFYNKCYCNLVLFMRSLNKETGQRGNPVMSNLPRKFNVAVSGSRDDFAHTHINDIGLQAEIFKKVLQTRLSEPIEN